MRKRVEFHRFLIALSVLRGRGGGRGEGSRVSWGEQGTSSEGSASTVKQRMQRGQSPAAEPCNDSWCRRLIIPHCRGSDAAAHCGAPVLRHGPPPSARRCHSCTGTGGSAQRQRDAPAHDLQRDVRPLVAQVVLQRDDLAVFILRPRPALDERVKVVVPPAWGRSRQQARYARHGQRVDHAAHPPRGMSWAGNAGMERDREGLAQGRPQDSRRQLRDPRSTKVDFQRPAQWHPESVQSASLRRLARCHRLPATGAYSS